MNFYYNGVDIYDDVSVNYCVHEMFAEKQADSLVIRFGDPKGVWSRWQPVEGDEIRFRCGAADTGKMFIHFMKPENGLFTIRALSLPVISRTKKSKSWEGIRFLQLADEFAGNNGLSFQNYGCTDQVYPYLQQNNEKDFAIFSRLCELEGCQMLVYDGKLLAYSEKYIESQTPAGTLEVGENGNFIYHDNRADCFGSCEVSSGIYSGSFTAPGTLPGTVLRPAGIHVNSNAEAARFAKGILRSVNKYGRTGQFSKALQTEYAAASILELRTQKASGWDGKVFVYRVRHDYVGNLSTLYFRHVLEGY